MKKTISRSMGALILVFGLNDGMAQVRFQAGDSFPNLALPSLQSGQPDSIANYRGQKLILHIFASW